MNLYIDSEGTDIFLNYKFIDELDRIIPIIEIKNTLNSMLELSFKKICTNFFTHVFKYENFISIVFLNNLLNY